MRDFFEGMIVIGALVVVFGLMAFIADPKERTKRRSSASVDDEVWAPHVFGALRWVGWRNIVLAGIGLSGISAAVVLLCEFA